uniref:Uncharacterized protein n=1 Tax=Chenopodium quinoa TaxID=63459 RepID=A0A803NEM6_CHEQI
MPKHELQVQRRTQLWRNQGCYSIGEGDSGDVEFEATPMSKPEFVNGGLAWSLSAVKNNRSGNGKSASAIPGPTGLPLIGLGHVFASEKTHRILSSIATSLKATPLMAFSVGLTRFVIASEPETAKEILNSSEFADRPIKESAYELLFNRAMGFAPFG